MDKKTVLLLSLVHPDFLPPVYAVAQVLRDWGYNIHILTYNSRIAIKYDVGHNIDIEVIGMHQGANTIQRIRLRNDFIKRAKQIASQDMAGVIAFCPFSFLCGLKVKHGTPLIYMALEIADFKFSELLRSPLSNLRNLLALRNIKKADLVATPSVQRSAWLAGRCHLGFMPYTILNTAYLSDKQEVSPHKAFSELAPASFLDKKIILYTGGVNETFCIKELVHAFDEVNDEQSALIIAGLGDNKYCNDIREFVGQCKSAGRIKLFPFLSRPEVFLLQSNAQIGVSLIHESQDNVKSSMMAPNKIGEYISKNLYILGINTTYLRQFQVMGIASLAESASVNDIGKAIKEALQAIDDKKYKKKIETFVKDYFCMQQQLRPVKDVLLKKYTHK